MNKKTLMQKRAALVDQARALADGEQTTETRATFDALMAQADAIKTDIARAEKLETETATLDESDGLRAGKPDPKIEMPAVNKTALGDSERRATAHYIRTGDMSRELRASNATDMNIGTSADGGYAVPTGHYQGIIAKRDEGMLADRLGVLRIPGQGTTVNVPVDNGTANAFVSTSETTAFDADAPALGQVAMTLVKYTKKVVLSLELLRDEDSRLLAFLDNYIGRAMAGTHNALLMTAALTSGTSVTLASASAASAGDVPKLTYSIKGQYADGAAWVMPRATEGAYRALTGNAWAFAPMPAGSPAPSSLWGFPVYNSEQSFGAVGAGNKSSLFGNFNFVGLREGSGFTFLRDPYSSAGTGQVNLFYYFDAVYKVLVSEAIVYGKHPTA
jgi:HK97 family phage major capsid protein